MDETGLVQYQHFIQCLNWRDHPVAPINFSTGRMDDAWAGNREADQIQSVNYAALLQDLLGKK